MFQEICKFIATRTGFVIGSSLQAGHRRQGAPDRSILVAETGGGDVPNIYARDMMFPNIQIISRSMTYFEARDDIWIVYDALTTPSGWNLPNIHGVAPDYHAMTITPLAVPQYLGEDENRRHEFSVNFIFRMEQATCGGATPSPSP
jgi:hypothetical protein